ncbi:hypothetical protein [Mycobacteroides abscessus]|uniref:hypothetical protein n=1 Tax=Mycobacteroides abscessus TaxID=36809 RepID=UPI000241CF0D|nr:hypothetical protein [Mycobacteroides abscessus]EHM15892.1 hypothetical protein MBOL_42810 [Mycobacteroides abscessus subsp. bolletii BD]ORA29982.1 hypothetical protein BST18_00110 [Mycobacteroides abscessus subsp. bolletii]TPF68405.1 hypothetical protein XW60_06080 [Mycobacteroides abscessus subsp. bolletii]SLD11250.1 Uncharacterised protein [Mycobacteroides abscessus subsp. bolletii]BBB42844.1 hypothetical protein MASB_34100 [Mycobacteroides abscessus subsp. bolletii BD]
MTALQPVWTPADYDTTVAALKVHQAVSVPGGVILPPKRGRRYRGQHRASKFRLTVADLRDGGLR